MLTKKLSGPDHYREAERLLSTCVDCNGDPPADDSGLGHVLAAAQVHATLALAAATEAAWMTETVDEWRDELDGEPEATP